MQNVAPAHSTMKKREEIPLDAIQPTVWPALSPDFNPIKSVWELMKSYVDDHPEPNSRRSFFTKLHEKIL